MKTLKLDPYLREIVQYNVCKLNRCSKQTTQVHYQKIHQKQLALGPFSIFYKLFTQDLITQINSYLYFIDQDTTKNQAFFAIKK